MKFSSEALGWQSLFWWGCSLVGIALFTYSLGQQTAIQANMNQTMETINQSIAATGGVVGQTTVALAPLVAVTSTLRSTQASMEHTVNHLGSMNDHLRTIGQTEAAIVQNLNTLNQTTSGVNAALQRMYQLNTQLGQSSAASVQLASQEAGQVRQLNQLTDTSINQLHQVNSRLAALRLLP